MRLNTIPIAPKFQISPSDPDIGDVAVAGPALQAGTGMDAAIQQAVTDLES